MKKRLPCPAEGHCGCLDRICEYFVALSLGHDEDNHKPKGSLRAPRVSGRSLLASQISLTKLATRLLYFSVTKALAVC